MNDGYEDEMSLEKIAVAFKTDLPVFTSCSKNEKDEAWKYDYHLKTMKIVALIVHGLEKSV